MRSSSKRSSAIPVPIDINTLTALKRSTLGLDLYLWLVYRTFAAPRSASGSPGGRLYRQFGARTRTTPSDKKTVQELPAIKVLRELKKIKLAWPGLNYTTAPGVLILHPSTPAIPPLNQAPLPSLVE